MRLELLVESGVKVEMVIVEMVFEQSKRGTTGLGQCGRGRGSRSGGFEGVLGDGLACLDGLKDSGPGRIVAGKEGSVLDATSVRNVEAEGASSGLRCQGCWLGEARLGGLPIG